MKKKLKRLLSLVIAAALICTGVMTDKQTAKASLISGQGVRFQTGQTVSYSCVGIGNGAGGYYSTQMYSVTDENGNTRPLFCIQPALAGLSTNVTGDAIVYAEGELMRRILFGGYQGGREDILIGAMQKYCPGITITPQSLYCMTHILLAYAYNQVIGYDAAFAGTGITEASLNEGGEYEWLGKIAKEYEKLNTLPASISNQNLSGGEIGSNGYDKTVDGYTANLNGWKYRSEVFTATGSIPVQPGFGFIDWTMSKELGSDYIVAGGGVWDLLVGHKYSMLAAESYYNGLGSDKTVTVPITGINDLTAHTWQMNTGTQTFAYMTMGGYSTINYNVKFDSGMPTENYFDISIVKNGEILSGVTGDEGNITFTYLSDDLSGIEFEAVAKEGYTDMLGDTHTAGEVLATATTDTDGNAKLTNIPFKDDADNDCTTTVTIREVVSTTPVTHIAVQPFDVTATWNATDGVVLTNVDAAGNIVITNERKKATVSAIKVDADNNAVLLPGAKFGLYNSSDITLADGTVILAKDSLIKTAVTGDNGKATFNADIPINNSYYIVELEAPEGFVLDDTQKKEFTFSDTATDANTQFLFDGSNAFMDIAQLGVVTVIKKGEVLSGAVQTGNSITFEYTEKELGGFTFDIYAAEDIKGSAENLIYANGTKIATVITGSANGTSYVDAITPLIFETNSEGTATVKGLPLGKYSIKEAKAADGYVCDSTTSNEVIVSGDLSGSIYAAEVQSTFTNVRKNASVKCYKKDANNTGILTSDTYIQGAEFTLYAGEDIVAGGQTLVTKDTALVKAVSNSEGEATFAIDLPYGFSFYAKETKAPEGYLIDDSTYKFTFTFTSADNEANNVFGSKATSAVNDKTVTGEIILQKYAYDTQDAVAQGGTSLNGAVYSLTAKEDIKHPGTGAVMFTAGTQIADLVTGKPAECISYVDTDDYKLVFETTANGEIKISNLLLGKYTVKETTAPEGLILDEDTYDVEITYINETTPVVSVSVTSYDDVKKAPLNIVKQGRKTNAPTLYNLSGAEFKLYLKSSFTDYDTAYAVHVMSNSSTGEEILVTSKAEEDAMALLGYDTCEELLLVTDSNGYAETGLLPYGTYMLHETKAPSGYKANITDEEVVINEDIRDGSFITADPIQVINILLTVVTNKGVSITKYEATGSKELPGAHLELYDAAGHLIDSWISTTEAHVVDGLHVGEKYTLKETIAPENYALAESITFVVEDNWQQGQQVKMYDKLKLKHKMGENMSILFCIIGFILCAGLGGTYVMYVRRKKNGRK